MKATAERMRLIRHRRVRKKVKGTSTRPRLSVYRSLRHFYAQAVDDQRGVSLCALSTLSPQVRGELKGNKSEQARLLGRKFAEMALKKGILTVVFDRGGFLYHGRVKAFAEGAREGGLQF